MLSIYDFPYTHVVKLEQLPNFISELQATQPSIRSTFLAERTLNSGIGLRVEDVFDARSAEIVADLYKDDFLRFGYRHRSFTKPPQEIRFTEREVAMILMLREKNERIRDMSTLGQQRRGGSNALRGLLNAAQQRFSGPH